MALGRRQLMAGAAAASLAGGARADGPDRIRFTADFRIYGGTAPFPYGVDRGFYKEQGIDCTVDGSLGSGDAVKRVASGAYDFGCADASAVVEFASHNPGLSPKIIMPLYDTNAACIVSLKGKPVRSMKDLEGITLGITATDAGTRILPVLLRMHGVDSSKINYKTVTPQLRDSLLARHDLDALIGFDYTALFDLIGTGIPREDVNLVHYSSIGFPFYGGTLIAARKWVEQNPDLVKRVAIAVTKSWVAANKDVKGAVASAVKREPLIDPKLEADRLQYILDEHVVTEYVRKNGLGAMDTGRLELGLKILSDGFQVPPVAIGDIYDDRFLPSMAERQV